MARETIQPEPRPDAKDAEQVPVVERVAVHRSPRIGAFLGTGAMVGVLLGVVLAASWLSGSGHRVPKPGVTAVVIVVTCVALGTLLAGMGAVVADRRRQTSASR